jgi:putative ABC transport system permease protein
VVRLVLRQGTTLVVLGIALGLPVAWGVSRLLGAFLIGSDSANVVSYLTASVVLAAIALLASWIPARRAAAVHPMVALRAD